MQHVVTERTNLDWHVSAACDCHFMHLQYRRLCQFLRFREEKQPPDRNTCKHEMLCPKLKDTAGVSLTYQQQQQASDSVYSDDILNPTPPVTFSSCGEHVISF